MATDFDSLWNFENPKETEEKFRLLLSEVDGDRKLELLTQIARSQGLQRDFDGAFRTLDAVKPLLGSGNSIAEVRFHLERGRVFNSSKRKPEAIPEFSRALELAIERGQENFAVDAAHMLAIAETEPARQHEWNLKAMALAESAKDPKARNWLGSLYNNIGWTHHDSGKFDEALVMFQKALAFRQNQGKAALIRTARWCVARCLRSLKKVDEALRMQMELHAELTQSGIEADGYVCEELGELHLLTGGKSESMRYFARAYELLSKDEWLKANEAGRLERLKELSTP